MRAVLESIAQELIDQPEFPRPRDKVELALKEPPVLANVLEFGGLLLKDGKLDQAERLYGSLAETLPLVPVAHVGLARTSMRRGLWLDALARWDRVIDRFPDHQTRPSWVVARASVLIELDRLDEAEKVLRGLTENVETCAAGLEGLARLAMRRNWWPEALEWSEQLLEEFGDHQNSHWIALRADALAALGRLDEAEVIFRELMGGAANQALGMFGFVVVLVGRHSWHDALAVLDTAFTRFPGELPPYADVLRARALFELGSTQEAEVAVRRLTRNYPGSSWPLVGLCQILLMDGRPDEVLGVLGSSDSRSAKVPGLIAARLSSLITLRRFPVARSAFSRLLADTDDPAALTILFEFTPRLFEGWQRTETWLALEKKIDWLTTSRRGMSSPSLLALRLRLLLALRNYDAFRAAFGDVRDTRIFGADEGNVRAVGAALQRPRVLDYGRPKVFGIGLSKTGTTSLAAALVELGFATIDWLNPLTGELMNDDDLHLFDAFTDTPSCQNFEKYYYMFPNAKFIYTVRRADDWERSWIAHFKRWYLLSDFQEIREKLTERDAFHFGARYADIYMALYFNHETFGEAFQAYDRRVRRFFEDKAGARFLVFDIFAGDSWQKLCTFLNRDVPSAPFPWENRAQINRMPANVAAAAPPQTSASAAVERVTDR